MKILKEKPGKVSVRKFLRLGCEVWLPVKGLLGLLSLPVFWKML